MRKISIANTKGITAVLTSYGARLMSLYVPDKDGVLADVVLGFNTPEDYLKAEEKYFGVIVGRYANRIANGEFHINNQKFTLAKNNPPNSLHGGLKGFHEKIWKVDIEEKDRLVMSCISEDGEEEFPGNLKVEVEYKLTIDNSLSITYKATTDKTTPINLTHHSYFNLKGHDQGRIDDHILSIHANEYTAVNENLIPTGKFESVRNSPFDFTIAKPIGQDIDSNHPQMILGNGYDHNYVLKKKNSQEVIHAATVLEPISGRIMEVHTNQPGLQFYTANWFSGKDIGKTGKPYHARNAFCLETQHFPDSPNQTLFPLCWLYPEETYGYYCSYKFL